MKQRVALLLVLLVTVCWSMPISGAGEYKILTVRLSGSMITPPQLQSGTSVKQGEWVRFLVDRDNFIWELPGGGMGHAPDVYIDDTMTQELHVKVFAGGNYFASPKLETEGGELYIALKAQVPGENIPLVVAVAYDAYVSVKSDDSLRLCIIGEETGGNPDPDPGPEYPETTDNLTIIGINPQFYLGTRCRNAWGSHPSVEAGGELWLPLYADTFLWAKSDGTQVYPKDKGAVTMAQITQGSITLGGNWDSALVDASLTNRGGTAGIALSFRQPPLSLEDYGFSADLSLMYKGVQGGSGLARVEGSIGVKVYTPGNDQKQFDIKGKEVIQPREDIVHAEIYLGCGVLVYADLAKGARYCGVAKEMDDAALQGDAVAGYVLETRNIPLDSTVFLSEREAPYVYDGDGNYLGIVSSRLPFRNCYYLRTEVPESSGGGAGTGGNGAKSNASSAVYKKPQLYTGAPSVFRGESGEEEPWEIIREDPLFDDYVFNIFDNPNTGNFQKKYAGTCSK